MKQKPNLKNFARICLIGAIIVFSAHSAYPRDDLNSSFRSNVTKITSPLTEFKSNSSTIAKDYLNSNLSNIKPCLNNISNNISQALNNNLTNLSKINQSKPLPGSSWDNMSFIEKAILIGLSSFGLGPGTIVEDYRHVGRVTVASGIAMRDYIVNYRDYIANSLQSKINQSKPLPGSSWNNMSFKESAVEIVTVLFLGNRIDANRFVSGIMGGVNSTNVSKPEAAYSRHWQETYINTIPRNNTNKSDLTNITK